MATLGYTTGLHVRYRAGFISASDNDPLTSWPDESGNSFDASHYVAEPVYKASGGPNGSPYVRCSRRGFRLPSGFYSGFAPVASEVFIVQRAHNNPAGSGLGTASPWNCFSPAVAGEEQFPGTTPSPQGRLRLGFCSTSVREITSYTQDITQFHLTNMRSAAGLWQLVLGGVLEINDGSNTFHIGQPTSGFNQAEMAETAANNSVELDYVEALYYDHVLSDANRETVLEYIRDEYGLDHTGGGSSTSPTITAVADSQTQITVTITPGSAPVDHNIYRSLTSGFTPSGATLLAAGLGASPAPYVDTGLTPNTTYFYQVVETSTPATSNELAVTTQGIPPTPTIRVDSIAATSIAVSIGNHVSYTGTELQIDTDSSFATATTVSKSGAGQSAHTFAGLTTSVTYWFRARANTAFGFTSWSNSVSATTTAAAVLPTGGTFPWIAPEFAEPHSGTVFFQWEPLGGNVVSLEVSDAYTATWTEIADANDLGAATSFLWDVSMEPDGFYRARITFADATVAEHPGFLIDAAGLHTFYPEMTQGFTDWGVYLDTSSEWAHGRFRDGQCANHVGPTTTLRTVFGQIGGGFDLSAMVPTTGIVPGTNGFVAGTLAMYPGNNGQILPWEFFYSTEHSKAGVGFASGTKAGGDQRFIAAYVRHRQLGHYSAFGSCGTSGIGSVGGEFVLEVGDETQATLLTFGEDAIVAAAHYGIGCSGQCYSRAWRYHVSLSWSRPDPGSFPNRYDIVARLGAPYDVVIEETVDLTAPLGCGLAGFVSGHQLHSNVPGIDQGWRETYNLAVSVTDPGGCEIPPPEIPPETGFPPPLPPSFPCALLYQHFEADGQTIEWEASSDPTIADGYLMEPTAYAEQEVDFLQGRASITSVTVAFIDPPATVGNQTTGVTTGRLGRL
jgi:hypothetical protein